MTGSSGSLANPPKLYLPSPPEGAVYALSPFFLFKAELFSFPEDLFEAECPPLMVNDST